MSRQVGNGREAELGDWSEEASASMPTRCSPAASAASSRWSDNARHLRA